MQLSTNNKTYAYIRVSTDKQDLDKQRYTILEYAHTNKINIDEFLEVEISSKQSTKDRKIDELLESVHSGDSVIVTEVSRFARNMLQLLNMMETLNKKRVKVTFILQPQLSTSGEYSQLLMAIYGFFAQAERDFISTRTKQGLAALKAQGKKLGRPTGRGKSKLDPYRPEIEALLKNGSTKRYVCQRYGVRPQSLWKWLKKNSIEASTKYNQI